MGRIGERFRALRARGEKALVTFVTAGDPDLAQTEALVLAHVEAGADAVEIGMPFSDPIGEGPTIQRASERALRGGVTLRQVFELIERLRPQLEAPLILMGYANNFLSLGEAAFAARAAAIGLDGVIAIDLPPEEGEELFGRLREREIDPILLAAPTTRPARLAMLAKETRGFLYFVSLTGVTGARQALSATLEREVREVRRVSDVPVCVGFGVSTPEHAREVARFADGVAVGSALIDCVERASSPEAGRAAAARLVAALKAPLRAG